MMKNLYYQNVSFHKSLKHAWSGLKLIFRDERNFRRDLVVAFCVIVAGILFKITHFEWVAISLVISTVLISEALNSVIEAICDTISCDFKLNIKYAKDVSAGAVLVSAIVSVITGFLVFTPYILELFGL